MTRLVIAILCVACAFSGSVRAETIVKDAWVRATPGTAKVTAGYVVIVNTGASDDVLTGVSAPSASMAHIHGSATKDGVMSMEPVTSLPVPAGKEVALSPGGYHVMIMGLKSSLKVGDELPLVFSFKRQGNVSITAKVMPLSYGGASTDPAKDRHSHK